MDTIEIATIEKALDRLRPSLDADGFDLRAGTVGEDGTVNVVLEARTGACLECLVPDELLLQLVDNAIREEASAVSSVTLEKVGF